MRVFPIPVFVFLCFSFFCLFYLFVGCLGSMSGVITLVLCRPATLLCFVPSYVSVTINYIEKKKKKKKRISSYQKNSLKWEEHNICKNRLVD